MYESHEDFHDRFLDIIEANYANEELIGYSLLIRHRFFHVLLSEAARPRVVETLDFLRFWVNHVELADEVYLDNYAAMAEPEPSPVIDDD